MEIISNYILAVGARYGNITLFNINNGSYITTLLEDKKENIPFNSILLLNLKYFATYTLKNIFIWRLSDLKIQTTLTNVHSEFIRGLKLLRNQLNMVSVSYNGEIKIWDTDSFIELACFQTCQNVWSLEIGENDLIAVGCDNGEVKIHDSSTYQLKATLYNGATIVYSIKSLSNGLIACGLQSKLINIWDISKGKILKVLVGHNYEVTSLELLGQDLLVSGSSRGLIKLWTISNGKEITSFKAHTNEINTIKIISGKGLL